MPDVPSAADILATATARLALAAEGYDVPGNVDAALRSILLAAHRDTTGVTPEAITLAVVALAQAVPAVVEHFGAQPDPTLVDLGLRSVGGVVRTFGVPPDEAAAEARAEMAGWFDWSAILLAEIDIAVRSRRIAARLATVAPALPGPASIH